jgi:subtilase family serine protease
VEVLEARTVPVAFTPAQIRHAYGFDQITFTAQGQTFAGDGSGQIIAIVAAYDDPNVAADLHVFDLMFGLPDPAFAKAMPQGQPAANAAWAEEIVSDVEWAHAIAPSAKILLVEARSANPSDLLEAVDYARRQTGVVAVSMSWAAPEYAGQAGYDGYFTTPSGHLGGWSGLPGARNLPGGITFVAASGDAGAAPQWPAASPNVLAVGGTSLTVLDSQGTYGWETAWSNSGGGYSTQEKEPAYQTGVQSSGRRGLPDVAYAADPGTSFFVYDSVPVNGYEGWFVVGGTSMGAPQWAALVAIADQGRALLGKGSLDGATQTLDALYAMAGTAYSRYFHDVTGGGNGYPAGPGYDAATGLGSPHADLIVQALVSVAGSGKALTMAPPPPAPAPTPTLPASAPKRPHRRAVHPHPHRRPRRHPVPALVIVEPLRGPEALPERGAGL